MHDEGPLWERGRREREQEREDERKGGRERRQEEGSEGKGEDERVRGGGMEKGKKGREGRREEKKGGREKGRRREGVSGGRKERECKKVRGLELGRQSVDASKYECGYVSAVSPSLFLGLSLPPGKMGPVAYLLWRKSFLNLFLSALLKLLYTTASN